MRLLYIGFPVCLVGDCDIVVNQVLGKFCVDTFLRRYYDYCIRRVERLLSSSLRPPFGFELLHYTPRKDNSRADFLANHALDTGAVRTFHPCAWNSLLDLLQTCPQSDIGICAQFDGAARGNPSGQASLGVAVWWGKWRLDGFEPFELLEEHAKLIGVASNNVAEYMGCAFALQLLTQRVLTLSQRTAELARPED